MLGNVFNGAKKEAEPSGSESDGGAGSKKRVDGESTSENDRIICIDNSNPVTVDQCRQVLHFMRQDRNFHTRHHWIGSKQNNPVAMWSLIGNPCHVDIRTPSDTIIDDIFSTGEAYELALAIFSTCIAGGKDGFTDVGSPGGEFMVTVGEQHFWSGDQRMVMSSSRSVNETS